MPSDTVPVVEGRASFSLPIAGKPCSTWYRVYGDLRKSTTRPCVVLHGGPGMGHNYLLPLADLATVRGIPIVLYDQLGCGNSTLLPEKRGDASFWTPDLFLDELENLLRHLQIESYDVYGNSWGGMLGALHALRQPKGLNRLVIANSPTDMHTWVAEANNLRSRLPSNVQEALLRHERDGTIDSDEYEAAVFEFYKRHVCRLDPMPKEMMDTFENVKRDNTVYWTMNGPSEFHVIGTLKDWVITPRVHEIARPTLLINGAHDEATDKCVGPWFNNLEHVKWVQFSKSSHTPHLEERERFMQVLSNFLHGGE